MSLPIRERLAQAQAEVQSAQGTAAQAQLEAAKQELARLTAEKEQFDQLNAAMGTMPAADLPVALLPVRIETRFIPVGAEFDFCVRVFPDDIHVEAHEPELLEHEVQYGRAYWEQIWRAATVVERRKAAWAQLAQQYGPQRAGWIARTMTPTNQPDRPAAPIPDGQPFTKPPVFPNPPRHAESWTRPPILCTLPDLWAFFGYRDKQRILIASGQPIPPELAAGPDPNAPKQNVPLDQLPVDPGMKWLVDFNEAVRVGMGIRMRLSAADAARGYDELAVVGIQASVNGAAGSAKLAALLDSQHYTDGLGFVRQGAPTNNMQGTPSGFGSKDPGFEVSFAAEVKGGETPRKSGDNASVAARALGIDSGVFGQIEGADTSEQIDARDMNVALWPATWGYLLDQMVGDAMPAGWLDAHRKFFIDHVRGQGPIPAIRVGRQPYGILPASSLERWKHDANDAPKPPLLKLLRDFRNRWRTGVPAVPRLGKTMNSNSAADDNLLQLLAMEPLSSGFEARPVVDGLLFGTAALPNLPVALPGDVQQRRDAVKAALTNLGFPSNFRLLEMAFLGSSYQLLRSLVQNGSDELARLSPNYIEWMRTAEFNAILGEVYPANFGPPGVKLDSLLYMLLRHSVLIAYADAAQRILKLENMVASARRPEPTLSRILTTDSETGLSNMDKTPPSLGGAKISARIHALTTTNTPAARDLVELRSSLSRLGLKPAGELERLLGQTLDSCSHRLDAWVTGLASERIAKIRTTKPTGVLLGGYGWVHDVKPDNSRQVVPAPAGESGRMMVDSDSGGFVHAPSLNQAATAAILRAGYLANPGAGNNQPFAVDLSSERVRRARFLLDGVREGQQLSALLGYRFERGLHEKHPDKELDRYIDTFRKLAPLGEIYAARAEKEDAQRKADAATAGAAAKRQEATTIVAQATAHLANLQQSRAGAAAEFSWLQEQATQMRREIQMLLSGGVDPSEEERLGELQAALNEAQARMQFLLDQMPTLDSEISTATSALNAANVRAQQLQAEAQSLDAEAATQGTRQQAAEARELALLAKRRAEMLLPPSSGTSEMESIAAQDVVDGLGLHKRYRKGIDAPNGPVWNDDSIPFGKLGLPVVSDVRAQAILAELRDLDESIDAVSDAITAESVHQTVLGNAPRAGATLDALSGGTAPAPELEVVRTPRTGTAITHRLCMLLADAPATPVWPVDALQARALAEPRLNAWAASVLGNPQRIRFRAEYMVDGVGKGLTEFNLSTFAISALDFLWMAEASERAAEGPLEQRLRFRLLRQRPAGIPATATVRLDFGRADNWGPDVLSVPEAATFARAVGQMISSARSLDSRDLDVAGSGAAMSIDVNDLGTRVNALVTAFQNAHNALKGLIANPATATAESLRSAIVKLSYFDVDAVPSSAVNDTPPLRASLQEQAASIVRETARRVAKLQQLMTGVNVPSLPPSERLELERERVAVILGKSFRIAPRFQAPNVAMLNQSLANASVVLAGDNLAPLTWLQRIARVRASSGRLNDVLTYSQSLTPGIGTPGLRVAQLPFDATDRWAALPMGPDKKRSNASLSVVLHVPSSFPAALPATVAGLMIDEWVDVTPSTVEQTGLAFHYDAPASRPPQAILLATPPGDQATWDIETLETIVTETLEMARLRLIEPAQLDGGVSHFVPALYFGLNTAGETISTDFQRAATAA